MEDDKFYEFLNHAVDLFTKAGYSVEISSTAEGELYLNAYPYLGGDLGSVPDIEDYLNVEVTGDYQ